MARSTTVKDTPFVMRALAALAVLLAAIFVSTALGSGTAYAADSQNTQAPADNGVVSTNTDPTNQNAVSTGQNETGTPQVGVENQDTEQAKAPANNSETLLGQSGGEALSTEASNQDVVIDLAPMPPDLTPGRAIGSDAVVTMECNAGEGVALEAYVDYMSIGDQVVDARTDYGDLTLPAGSGYENILINWYYYEAPFAAGTYYSDPEEYQAAVSGSGGSGAQYDLSGGTYTDIDAQGFLNSYACANPASVVNRFYWQNANGSSENSVYIPYHAGVYPVYQPWQLFFDEAGQQRIAAQATYVIEKREERTDADGSTYIFVSYVLHVSNQVQFVINVNPSPTAQLKVSAKDQDGNIVDINASQNNSNFEVRLSKYFRYTDTAPDGDYDYAEIPARHDGVFGSDDETFRYNLATAGFYKLSIVNKFGNYEPYSDFFQLTPEQIATGVIEMPIVLNAVAAPVMYKVEFFDEDGTTVLLAAKEYNENTLGSVVEKPQNMPTKAEDDEYCYVFDHWLVTPDDRHVSWGSALDVTSDMTYKAVFRGISKTNDPGIPVVYASGGLFGKPKPSNVVRYDLAVSKLDAAARAGILGDYSSYIGNNSVAAVYEVDLTQYNKDGTTENLTEGIGDMVLSFVVPGVDDGAKAMVIQLHEVPGAGSPAVILHPNLVVSGGKVDVPLDGRLSTFIVTLETESDDPEGGSSSEGGSGTEGESGSQSGTEGGSQSGTMPASQDGSGAGAASEGTTPSAADGSNGKASEAANGGEVVVSSDKTAPVKATAKVKTEPVKGTNSASSAAAASAEMPQTGDPISAGVLVLAAIASAMVGLAALSRRKSGARR